MSAPQRSLRMEGISKAFAGIAAVRNASLEAHGGEAMAVMGANGAGKSTLMNILGGVVASDSGQIILDGAVATIRSPRAGHATRRRLRSPGTGDASDAKRGGKHIHR